jgi:hypothetical protein
MKKAAKYQVVDHGVESCQYFQGCGVSSTEYDTCYTGIGDSAHEALEDALESAAQSDWDVEGIPNTLSKEVVVPEDETGETHYYITLRLKNPE